MKYNLKNKAFSLIELSIVILIIAILIVITSAATKITYSSKLKKIYSDFAIYDRAFKEFSFQYNQLPGDLPSHFNFWSDANYGDGNGDILWYSEGYYAWQHLSKAALIVGSFDGTTNATYDAIAESNVPKTQLTDILWSAFGDSSKNNYSLFIGKSTSSLTRIDENSLSPKASFFLDHKFDDSYPETGSVRIDLALTNSNCIDDITDNPKNYNKSSDTESCDLYFILN